MDGNGAINALLSQIRPQGVPVNAGLPVNASGAASIPPRGFPPRGMMPPPPPAAGLLVPPPPPPHILAGMKRAREDDVGGGAGMAPLPLNNWPPMGGNGQSLASGPPGSILPSVGLLPGQSDLKKQSRDPRRR